MGDRKLTLFELHLHGDNQFGPNIGEKVGSDEDETEGEEDGDGGPDVEIEAGGGAPAKGLLGLLALVLVVVLVKRLLGGDEETADEPDES